MEPVVTLSKMKVADLKKELKARGLSVVGNKNDLLERLQEAMECGGDNVGLEGGEAGEEEFDEEEILGEEDIDSELTLQEEEAALGGATIRVKEDSALLEPTEKKKISLKRTQPPPLSPPTPTPTLPTPQEDTQAPEGKADTQGQGDDTTTTTTTTTTNTTTTTTTTTSSPPPKKVIKLDAAGEKTDLKARAERFGIPLTEAARKEARIARFGLTAANGTEGTKTTGQSEEERKLARAARFGLPATGGAGGGKILVEGEKVEIDRLMKRAERFGEVTSPALIKATEEEKKKQRSERFGATATATNTTKIPTESGPEDTLAKRRERFGIVAATDEEEKKRKRAERFAI